MDNTTVKAIISRDEATERGLSRYFTGVECNHGHVSERYTSTAGCIACLRRTVPNKRKPTPVHFLPAKALAFVDMPAPQVSEIEAQAAFRYIEACGWHLAALKALRADPVLMNKHDHEWTLAERATAANAVKSAT